MRPFYRLCWLLVRIFMTVFCRLKIIGRENIPGSGGFILASNHISAVDPPFIGSSIGRPMFFMAKKELFDSFIMRNLIGNLNAMPIDRAIFDRNALRVSRGVLEDGFGLIMFPEGTRSKTGELGRGRPGIGMLARSAIVPIVPAYIHNSAIFHKVLFKGKRLVIIFGEPLDTGWIASVSDDKDGYRRIASEVMERIRNLRAGMPE